MDTNHKKILKALSLELRHLLEGEYDATGQWHGGDLEQRLNALGIWRDRDPLPADELPHLTPSDREARDVVDAYLELRRDASIPRDQAVAEFVRETAYTWANRLLALRCMEARGLIDEVILQKSVYGGRSLEHHRLARRNPELCVGGDDGLFAVLDQAFERQAEYLPLLFDPQAPGVALKPSVAALKRCVALLSGTEAVKGQEATTDEIFKAPDALGWAYQYWNTEEKDRVFEKVRTQKGAKIEGADIIPATQLYTEPYMVKFLVQNSLGALWMGMYPESRLYERWKYYVRDADHAPVERKPVREITFLDPAGGSGHFLLESFDMFYDMYLEEGEITDPQAICASVLQNNLFGIDIDERAVQIAEAALWMKAAERAFDFKGVPTNLVATNIRLPKGKDHMEAFLAQYPEDAPLRPALEVIFEGLEHADELGSLLQIEEPVEKVLRDLQAQHADAVRRGVQLKMFEPTAIQGTLPLGVESYEGWKVATLARLKAHFAAEVQAANVARCFFSRSAGRGLALFDLLARRYGVVAANPPYMGSRNFGGTVDNYLKAFYPEGKTDLYSAFVVRCMDLLTPNGVSAMVTQQSWLFLAQYRLLRCRFLEQSHMLLLGHLGPRAFQEISGAKVNVVLFVAWSSTSSRESLAIRLVNLEDATQKAKALVTACAGQETFVYRFQQAKFKTLPGMPFVYWMSCGVYNAFSLNEPLGEYFGNYNFTKTGRNDRFLRYFWEIPASGRWIWLTKGGTYRKWVGNEEYRIDWSVAARTHYREDRVGRITEEKWWYLPGVTYTTNTSKGFSARYHQGGGVSDYNGPCLSGTGISDSALLGILNSRAFNYMVRFICGPLAVVVGDIQRVPSPRHMNRKAHLIHQLESLVSWCCILKDYLISQELCERRCNPLLFYRMSAQEVLNRSLAVETLLASAEGKVEHTVLDLYEFSDEDFDEIIDATGCPAGWFPLIQGYSNLPTLPSIVRQPSVAISDLVVHCGQRELSSEELTNLRKHLCALFRAGPGAGIESDETVLGEIEENDDTMRSRIPIPTETFLEGLSQQLKIHPFSIYWLLKEGIEQEGWRCLPEERRVTADRFTVTILRLLGHRWPRQIEAGEPIPAWADADGIIPLTEGTNEATLLERMRDRVAEEFEGDDVTAIEREFEEIMGKPLEQWLTVEFFRHHTRQFKKRPIAWQIQSGRFTTRQKPAFACLVYYHKLDSATLATIQSQYVRPLRQRYETELRGIESIPAAARSARQDARRLELEVAIHELRDFDATLEQVATQGFASEPLAEIVAQEPLDAWCSIDGVKPPPEDREVLLRQEQSYIPDINDGVRVNVAPLQKAGLLAANVLSAKDVDKAIADRAEWRADERRWCREGKLPRPGWWE